MIGWRENPVARHGGRLATGRGWGWRVLLLFLAAAGLGALLQAQWMELPEYSFLRPQFASRWLGLTLLAEAALALPWAAVRGSLLWRRLLKGGLLEEYRRSRLAPAAIVGGALLAVLRPVFVLLALSLVAATALGLWIGEPTPQQTLAAHLLLAAQAAAFGALGLWLAARLRHPALAIPVAFACLAFALGAIALLDPFYRALHAPERWIYWALLPNPVTAVGNLLNTDVLRFGWVYERLGASEYFYVYPPAWQTAGVYLLLGALCFGRTARRVRHGE